MFKKAKDRKNGNPPVAPSLDEVLSDIETFHVDSDISNKKAAESSSSTKDDWWTVFEQFIEDLKCLEMVHTEIEGAQIKLESLKLEIDTESKLLKNEIHQNQRLIEEAYE